LAAENGFKKMRVYPQNDIEATALEMQNVFRDHAVNYALRLCTGFLHGGQNDIAGRWFRVAEAVVKNECAFRSFALDAPLVYSWMSSREITA
jgi:hypothetical protein